MSRSSSLVIALVWTALLWVGRDRLPDMVWTFLLVVAVFWVARAGARVLEGVVGQAPQPAGPVTVYVDDWGDRPEEVVQEARRLGCDLHPRILERNGRTRVAVAIRISEETASTLAASLRAVGADVSLRWRGRRGPRFSPSGS